MDTMVEIDSGKLAGLRRRDGLAFLGIPYADDTARTRFAAPQAPQPWAGVRHADALGERCPQTVENIVHLPVFAWYGQDSGFGENCCVLNVFTPDLRPQARRPVIVYVHGGGYSSGGGGGAALDGGRLAAFGDVVVVTLNHRLNVFGYSPLAALGDEGFADAGHAGQLDLIAALRWVQRNIAAFGGDAGCVTLAGQSGGGNKLMTLLVMPEAQGLFHRVINMSGVSGLRLAQPQDTQAYVHEWLRRLGIGANELHRLRALPGEALQRARQEAMVAVRGDGTQPVVDGRHVQAQPFGDEGLAMQAQVPMLMGSTDSESTLFLAQEPRHLAIDETELLARIEATFSLDRPRALALVASYREQADVRSAVDVLVQLSSDVLTRAHLIHAAERKAAAGGAPVFLYNFAWQLEVDGGIWRSPHTMDIPFAFGTLACARGMLGETLPAADETARRFMGAFVAFARHGDPSHADLPRWPRYDTHRRATMVFDAHCRVVDDYRAAGRIASAPLALWPPIRLTRGPLFRGLG